MKFSRGLSVLLLIALPLTLPFRNWEVRPRTSGGLSSPLFAPAISDFLTRNGYSVSVGKIGRIVFGIREDCRIALIQADFARISDDALLVLGGQRGFSDRDQIIFVYRGKLLASLSPVMVVVDVWARLLRRDFWYPVVGVRYSPLCKIESLPWSEIERIAAPA